MLLVNGYMEFDITAAVQNWQSGDPNHGLLIWATNELEEGRDIRFASKESSDSTTHAASQPSHSPALYWGRGYVWERD